MPTNGTSAGRPVPSCFRSAPIRSIVAKPGRGGLAVSNTCSGRWVPRAFLVEERTRLWAALRWGRARASSGTPTFDTRPSRWTGPGRASRGRAVYPSLPGQGTDDRGHRAGQRHRDAGVVRAPRIPRATSNTAPSTGATSSRGFATGGSRDPTSTLATGATTMPYSRPREGHAPCPTLRLRGGGPRPRRPREDR